MTKLPTNVKTTIIFIITLISASILMHIEYMPDVYSIHNYIDKRSIHNINYFFHVITSIPYAVVGITGIYIIFINRNDNNIFHHTNETIIWYVFYLATILTTIGSIYYHLAPNNERIIWDHIPGIIMLSCLFSYIIFNATTNKLSIISLPITITIGTTIIILWGSGLSSGSGNMLYYISFQVLIIMMMILITKMFENFYEGKKYIFWIIVWYILSIIFKWFDAVLYIVLSRTISGHSLHHLALAISMYYVMIYILRRSPRSYIE